ncbi:hypothetical protein TW85_16120 [Marinomonas sp. S3726]|uniref:hypothetical protein n=1 Tax=Marinomonas sp. S3726 TaxID=579484 RepID=UPI0005FA2ACE|nr:hypothetical protein [Marinomonas sp. S3726]KJZ11907.1 hypothetical protein TW85_16120 [Marinomonas sp. S3726]
MKAAHWTVQEDVLSGLRSLPEDLQKDVPVLTVNRQGASPESYMRTENYLGYVQPNKVYQLQLDGMYEAEDLTIAPLPQPIAPPRSKLTGDWQAKVDLTIDDANILGGNGRYLLNKGEASLKIAIAEATPEHLAYYHSRLVKIGDAIKFDASGNLPLTVTSVGKDYPQEYLLKPELGGGAYLEVHDRPHFHMPLDETCGGYLIIGKRNEEGLDEVSAFQVPFGYGIHMAPWAIHADAYITGRFMVIYSATPEFSTVIVRQENGELASIEFTD